PTPPPGSITKDVPVSNLAASTGQWIYFTFSVPAGATNLNITTSGGSGDADLYVRSNSQPTTSTYDCRSWSVTNIESCTIAAPQAGTCHIGIRAYSSFSGVTLVGTYQGGGFPGNELEESNLSASSGSFISRQI